MKVTGRPLSGRQSAEQTTVSALPPSRLAFSALFLLIGMLCAGRAAFAQGSPEIFREIPAANLSTGDNAGLEGPNVVRSRYVEIDVARILPQSETADSAPSRARGTSSRRLTFNLFSDAVQEFEQERGEYSADGSSFVWYGRPSDGSGQTASQTGGGQDGGQAVMVVRDGAVTGSVRTTSGEFYRIRSLGSSVHAIRQVVYQGAPPAEDAVPVPESDVPLVARLQEDGVTAEQSGDTTLDVMVVYTAGARAAAGGSSGIQNEIQLAIAELNQSFANSGVQMQARLAHSAEVAYGNEGDGLSTTLSRLRSSGDGFMDQVHTLRDQYGADVVALLVNGPGSNGGTVGTGYIMQTVGGYFAAYAFSVTEVNFATGPSYALLHEIGHNLGCAHDRANAGSAGAFSYSYGYPRSQTPRFRTIMSYNCSGVNCPTVNHWSNPNVNYQGYPTGVSSGQSNAADNRQTLNNTKATATAWRQGSTNMAPTVGTMTPSSGSGASKAFTTTFSDANGSTDLRYLYWLYNSALAWAGSCGVRYDRAANKLELIDEAGAWWQSGVTPGGSGTLSNSRCSVNASSVSVSGSGNTLTASFTLNFNAAFSGSQTVWLNASDTAGALADWQVKGSWTVPSSGGGGGGGGGGGSSSTPAAPTIQSYTPSSGSGSSQAFTTTLSDANGANDLVFGYWLMNTSLSWSGSCGVRYDRTTNLLSLINEEGSWWQTGITPGSGSLSNSRCSVNGSSVSVNPSGNTLTVSFTLNLNSTFSGAKNVWLNATDASGALAGWLQKGSWTVTSGGGGGGGSGGGGGGSQVPPVIQSFTPTSGTGASQTFATTLTDANGASDLVYGYWLINTSVAWAGSCGVRYNRAVNKLELINEDGSWWQTGISPGSGSLSNSRCSVNGSSFSANSSGNTLNVSFTLNFKSAFSGAKSIWLNVSDSTGPLPTWQQRGSWTVPGSGGTGPAAPVIGSITPSSGTGTSRAFVTTVSDGNGASDLRYVYWMFNQSYSWAGSCGVRYDRSQNKLALIDEQGGWWQTGITPGNSGTLSNSRCSLNVASGSAGTSGNNLTVGFTLNFSGSFRGSKYLWLNAMDESNALAGWSAAGTWVVP